MNDPTLYLPLDLNTVLSATKGLYLEANAVVSIYEGLLGEDDWSYTGLWGALYFGKDLINNCFHLMLVNVDEKKLVWSHECYENLTFSLLNNHFASFESDDKIIGFNFAINSPNPADKFTSIVNNLSLENSNPKKPSSTGNRNNKPMNNEPSPREQKKPSSTSQKTKGEEGGIKGWFKGFFGKKTEKVDKRPSRDSMVFGEAKGMKRVAHVGINPETGVFEMENLPKELMEMLGGLGLSKEQTEDPEIQKKVVKYMHKYEMKVAKERMKEEQRIEQENQRSSMMIPPIPSSSTTTVPPPPVVNIPKPPPIPVVSLNSNNVIEDEGKVLPSLPPRPKILESSSSGFVPPPPIGLTTAPSIPKPPSNDAFVIPPPPTDSMKIPSPPTMDSMKIPQPPPISIVTSPSSEGHLSPIPVPPVSPTSPISPKIGEEPHSRSNSQPQNLLLEIQGFKKGSLKTTDITKFTPQEKEGFKKYLVDKFKNARFTEDDGDSSDDSENDDW
ncbi:hypothetical protein ABK040_010346 [Willaertia magna]